MISLLLVYMPEKCLSDTDLAFESRVQVMEALINRHGAGRHALAGGTAAQRSLQ
jgi:hypothetical protein